MYASIVISIGTETLSDDNMNWPSLKIKQVGHLCKICL